MADRLVAGLVAAGAIETPAVEEAMRAISRHLFVPEVPIEVSYANEAIPTKVLDGKAVSSASQPSIVAVMLEQLELRAGLRVLEIGACTGYNAALLAHLVGPDGHVVSVDIDEDIVEAARGHLADAGVNNVEVLQGDGGFGDEPGAPYDRIVLTVGASDIAPAWWEQLVVGGRLVLPLSVRGVQRCVAFDKRNGSMESASVRDCGFMRLRGAFAGPERVVTVGSITLTFDSEVDAAPIADLLARPAGRQELDIDVGTDDGFGGLALWLALGDPASFDGQALAVLGRERNGLVVQVFGSDNGCPERLLEGVKQWDAAQRPDSRSLTIRAYRYPRDEPTDREAIRIQKRWTTLLVEWRALSLSDSPTAPAGDH
jgi:protein-L-isoaspartate(D-aspartate) O-methyltransferase